MKRSGSLPHEVPKGKPSSASEAQEGIDFFRARITRDADGTVWCDQTKYILHCLCVKNAHTLPAVDAVLIHQKLVGTPEKNKTSFCRCNSFRRVQYDQFMYN